MNFLRNLLLGDYSKLSKAELKYGILRGEFALITIAIGVFYIILDTINKVSVFIPWYIMMIGLAIITILLNRKKYFILSSVILLVMVNGFVYIFADVDSPYGGVFFYFFASSITGLVLVHYKSLPLAFVFALLPLLLGVIAFNTDLKLLPYPEYEEGVLGINFMSNFIMGNLTIVFMVFFLIKLNTEYEELSKTRGKELSKTTAELKESEERLALAVRGAAAGIYEWRHKDNNIYLSPYWKKLLGYQENEIMNLTVKDFLLMIHPDDVVRSRQIVEANLKENKPYQTEIRLLTKDGNYKWFQDNAIARVDDDGNTKIVGLLIDINERKLAEEQLEQKNIQLGKANEELDRFVYSASHDMRAPLSSLLGLIYITEKSTSAEEIKDCLERMKARLRVMDGFIREVTDYSRNTRLAITNSEIVVKDLVEEVVDGLIFTQQPEFKININVQSDFKVMTDSYRLKVILNNLIQNAIKYADDTKLAREIEVNTDVNDIGWTIAVSDNGIGIAKEHLANIFDMFYRASEKSEGSGLGLYIVKEAASKLGASVSVNSEPGKGSTFKLHFPTGVAKQ